MLLALGVLTLGLLAPDSLAVKLVEPIGQLWVNGLRMTIVPLIAALLALPFLKHVYVCDEDVDIFSDEDVEWAMANRFIKMYQAQVAQLQNQVPPNQAQIDALQKLIEQLQAAGVSKKAGDDPVTEQDKTRLLDYLREVHGNKEEKKKITLTRKQTTEIKRADSTGKARTIQVEVRKKRVFVKRDGPEPAPAAEEAVAPPQPVVTVAEFAFGMAAGALAWPASDAAFKPRLSWDPRPIDG